MNDKKQARKGFRPLSAMQGIEYFQNLRNFLRKWKYFGFYGGIFLELFCNFWGIFQRIFLEECLCENVLRELFWEDFFGGIFLGKFFGRNFWEELFGRNSLFTLLKLFEYERFWFLSRFCLISRGRNNFRSLEVRVQAYRT